MCVDELNMILSWLDKIPLVGYLERMWFIVLLLQSEVQYFNKICVAWVHSFKAISI